MILSHCPRCHESFRVPAGQIPEDAFAHCPWCRESFPISEVLNALPPALEIVTADGHPLVVGEAPMTAAGAPNSNLNRGSALAGGLELLGQGNQDSRASDETIVSELRGGDFEYGHADRDLNKTTVEANTVVETIADEPWDGPGFGQSVNQAHHASQVFDDATLDDDATLVDHSRLIDPASDWDPATAGSMKVTAQGTPRKKRKGAGIGTMIGIVLGGLMSVPIAGLILMLLGRTPDWGFWPFLGEDATSSVRAAPPLLDSIQSDGDTSPGSQQLRVDDNNRDPEIDPSADVTGSGQPLKETDLANGDGAGLSIGQRDPVILDSEADSSSIPSVGSTLPANSLQAADSEQPSDSHHAGFAALPDAKDATLEMPTISTETKTSDKESAARHAAVVDSTATSAPPATQATSKSVSDRATVDAAARAIDMVRALVANPPDDSAELNRWLNQTYMQVTEAAGQAGGPSNDLAMLALALANADLADEIELAGWKWVGIPNRTTDGVAIVGQVSKSEKGPVLTNDSGKSLPLWDATGLPEGSPLVIIGRIVDEGAAIDVLAHSRIP